MPTRAGIKPQRSRRTRPATIVKAARRGKAKVPTVTVSEERPGHKYTRRWRDPETQEWRYEYPEEAAPPRAKKPAPVKKPRKKAAPEEAGREEYTGEVIDFVIDARRAWAYAVRDAYSGVGPTKMSGYSTREAMQNSLDAIRRARAEGKKAGLFRTEFDLRTGQAEKKAHVVYEDDGIGMDPITLRDKFLALYGSGKEGMAGQTGGFGLAKAVILGLAGTLGQWVLHTRDLIVNNQEVGNITSFRRTKERTGTRLDIEGGEILEKFYEQYYHIGYAMVLDDERNEGFTITAPVPAMVPFAMTDCRPGERMEFTYSPTDAHLPSRDTKGYEMAGQPALHVLPCAKGKLVQTWDPEKRQLTLRKTGGLEISEREIVDERDIDDDTHIRVAYLDYPALARQLPEWALKEISSVPPRMVVRLDGIFMFAEGMYADTKKAGAFIMDVTTKARPIEGGGNYPFDGGRTALRGNAKQYLQMFSSQFATDPQSVASKKDEWDQRTVTTDPELAGLNESLVLQWFRSLTDHLGVNEETLQILDRSTWFNQPKGSHSRYDADEGGWQAPEWDEASTGLGSCKGLAAIFLGAMKAASSSKLRAGAADREARFKALENIGRYVRDNLAESFDIRRHESARDIQLPDHLRLAVAWDTMLRMVCECYDSTKTTRLKSGFVLQDPDTVDEAGEADRAGEIVSEGGGYTVRINPFTIPATSSGDCAIHLWQTACHELAHLEGSRHNQEFNMRQEEIQRRSLPLFIELQKIVGMLEAHKEVLGPKDKRSTASKYRKAIAEAKKQAGRYDFSPAVGEAILAGKPLTPRWREGAHIAPETLQTTYRAWLTAGEPEMYYSSDMEGMLQDAGRDDSYSIVRELDAVDSIAFQIETGRGKKETIYLSPEGLTQIFRYMRQAEVRALRSAKKTRR